MVKVIKYSDQEVGPLVLELEKELLSIKKIIGALEANVNTLQLGNNSPYWNGTNAYQFFKSCGAQIEHDSFLLENLNQCLEYLRDKSNKND